MDSCIGTKRGERSRGRLAELEVTIRMVISVEKSEGNGEELKGAAEALARWREL